MLARTVLTCAISAAGAISFSLLHLPIPWLLGPMIAVLAAHNLFKLRLVWPSPIRNAGIVIVGYSMGLSLTREALAEIGRQLPSMLILTVSVIAFCAVIAFTVSKLTGIGFPTMMTGCIPGGLTQMLTLAEEFKQIDMTVVTLFQVTRLMAIVICLPLLLFSPLIGGEHIGSGVSASAAGWNDLFPMILAFLPLCLFCAWAGKKLRLPTAYMLGPMIGTAAAGLMGLHGPVLPSPLLNLSQLLIGTYVGLLLHPGAIQRKGRTISLALASGIVLIGGSLAISEGLSRTHGMTLATAFLAAAPGGMDQMAIMAHETGADLSIVTGYQTFRLLFIYFAVPPVLKAMFRYAAGRTAGQLKG